MTDDPLELFVGPAVVVDDRIDEPFAGMLGVLEQIEEAGLPIVKMTELPPLSQIKHWRGFALIVLDWELLSPGSSEPGVALPDALKERNAEQVSSFISRLLSDLYCPIFILSNEDTDVIADELEQRLTDQADDLDSRVMVRSKASTEGDLFGELGTWVSSHCAVHAVKRWEKGYEEAKRRLFQDFQMGSARWPQILWNASVKDGVNPHFELTETISRNILHRFEPLVFSDSVFAADDVNEPSEEVRAVIHRRAVVDAESLHDDVLMPGDFFIAEEKDGLEEDAILINVTPACDLVARAGTTLDDVEMTLLPATLVALEKVGSRTKREDVEKKLPSTQALVWVMRPDALPYLVNFKGWRQGTWGNRAAARRGRLLEPYIIDLQQRFALHFHRQGLPRLPTQYYPKS